MSDYYKPTGFGGFSFFPPVLKNLLIINGVVFFLELLSQNFTIGGVTAYDIILRWFALMPIGSGYFEAWQLISYQFLHGGFTHILFNMFALWMFGVEIENIWGSKRFLIFYLSCGIVAGVFHLLLSPLLNLGSMPTIGASGAIYGVMIAFAMLFPNRYIFLYFFIPVKAKYLIAFMVLIEFFAVDSANSNIAHLAHLGGALAGFVYVMYDRRRSLTFGNFFKRNSGRSFRKVVNFHNPFSRKEKNIQDAKFYEIDQDDSTEVTQKEIDEILDKISKSGYQNLTEKEKKILFEASKKMK